MLLRNETACFPELSAERAKARQEAEERLRKVFDHYRPSITYHHHHHHHHHHFYPTRCCLPPPPSPSLCESSDVSKLRSSSRVSQGRCFDNEHSIRTQRGGRNLAQVQPQGQSAEWTGGWAHVTPWPDCAQFENIAIIVIVCNVVLCVCWVSKRR